LGIFDIITDQEKVIIDKNMGGRSGKGSDMFSGRFWFFVVVMVATIAVGGILLS